MLIRVWVVRVGCLVEGRISAKHRETWAACRQLERTPLKKLAAPSCVHRRQPTGTLRKTMHWRELTTALLEMYEGHDFTSQLGDRTAELCRLWLKGFLVQDASCFRGGARFTEVCFFFLPFGHASPRMDFSGCPGGVVEGDSGSAPTFEPVAKIRQEDGAQVVSRSRGAPSASSPKTFFSPTACSSRSSSTSVERSRPRGGRRSGPCVEVGSRNLCYRRGRPCSVGSEGCFATCSITGTGAASVSAHRVDSGVCHTSNKACRENARGGGQSPAVSHCCTFATKKLCSKMEFLVLQVSKRRARGQTSQILCHPQHQCISPQSWRCCGNVCRNCAGSATICEPNLPQWEGARRIGRRRRERWRTLLPI